MKGITEKPKGRCDQAPKVMGGCHNFTRMWSYMKPGLAGSKGACEDFAWGGCPAGSDNLFWTEEECIQSKWHTHKKKFYL